MHPIKRFFIKAAHKISTPLPQTEEEFEVWAKSILTAHGFEYKPEYIHSFATMIQHWSSNHNPSSAPKLHFVKALKRGIANEVAFNVLAKLREEHKKEMEKKKQEQLLASSQDAAAIEITKINA